MQSVLITGASSGIGHRVAATLLDAGLRVHATARRLDRLHDLAARGAHIAYLDVTDEASIRQCVAQIIDEHGSVDVLFSNAGYGLQGPIECLSIEDAQRQFDVNVFGNVRVINALLPQMRAAKRGRIIITTSVVGQLSVPGMAWYPASKHALEAIADGLRIEVKKFGIDVIKIQPGFIRTEFAEVASASLDQAAAAPAGEFYAAEIETFREAFGQALTRGSSPDSISRTVLKAIRARRPKRAYMPNFDARAFLFAKRWLGDGFLDLVLPKLFFH